MTTNIHTLKSLIIKTISSFIFCCFLFFTLLTQAQKKQSSYNKDITNVSLAKKKCKDLLNLSQRAYNEANFDSFKKYNDSVLFITQKFELKELEIKSIINHGIYYNVTDAYEKALEKFHNALEFNKTNFNSEITEINILVNLASVYSQINKPDKVITYMEKVLALTDKNNVSNIIKLAAYNGLGNSYTEKKDYEKSLAYLYKMKNLAESINNIQAVNTALDNIGYSYFQQEKWDKVITTANESLVFSKKNGVSKRPVSLLNLGMSYLQKEDPKKAIPLLKEVLVMAINRKDLELKKEAHSHLAKAYKLLGDFENSQKEQESYSELMNTLLKEQSNAALLDLKHDSDTEKQNIESKLHSLTSIDNKKSKLLIGGGVSIVFLGGLLFFYARKKKIIETDRERFKKTNSLLQNENKALKAKMIELAAVKKEQTPKTVQYKNSSLTEKDKNYYMKIILNYMEKEKPYLDFEINQSELASQLSMSKHHLSEVLNLCFDQNFYQFINLYRVNDAQKIMKNSNYKDYKILAIAYEAGFKSKTSFNRVFKNHTGFTPSEFRKQQLSTLAV
ncbi:AraC-like DNA-binding protein [Tenacibaculum gallaicum]|uniref:AraC-like DNA-binding protein n=1 Tax=Tenacibaculum gallaicum TaxID=561505 RepID=A0A3E0HHD5_9FLAO|nr:helix-turn-helix domain-containing protein [Tenacibaculum gallaicum]REH45838.1 AraC-like DNA-binding protein [Tenacibaculum gallaicum]